LTLQGKFNTSEKMTKKVALITGITGQDGSYLAELLLRKGYEVHGIVRRVAIEHQDRRLWRILHVLDKVHLHHATLESYASLFDVVQRVKPKECYHLAAQSYVQCSFEDPFSTMQINAMGTLYLLSAIKELAPTCKFYFAGTSEMFGTVQEGQSHQDENTPFHPRSPYGISKVAGFSLIQNYREAYGVKAWNGILFNHESPRRGAEFVSRKITSYIAQLKKGSKEKLHLGNIDIKRDWGYTPEYVHIMWKMLQTDPPRDYVIGTGMHYTIKEFLKEAFAYVDLDWNNFVEIDQKFFRPLDVLHLHASSALAQKELGWSPKITFSDLVKIMMDVDLARVGVQPPGIGLKILSQKMGSDLFFEELMKS